MNSKYYTLQARFSRRAGYRDGFIFNFAASTIATVYDKRFRFPRLILYSFFKYDYNVYNQKSEIPGFYLCFQIWNPGTTCSNSVVNGVRRNRRSYNYRYTCSSDFMWKAMSSKWNCQIRHWTIYTIMVIWTKPNLSGRLYNINKCMHTMGFRIW